ncbi:MAG: hypothetical protein AAGA31_20290, partial [Bacteroidota bacterium]
RFGYGTSQNGDLYRYDKVSGYYVSIQPPAPQDTTLRFNWNAAFARDPFDDNTVYSGSQFVHKSTDEGATWTIISPDLSTDNPEHQQLDYGGLTLDLSGAERYNSILSIAPSPIDREVIWAGTDDGQLHLTRDGGQSWTKLTARVGGMPKEAWIARVIASEYAAGTAWLVVNNYRKGDYNPYLFRTDNFGATWTKLVRAGEVKGYALSFIQDPVEPNLQFLGTENGLWVTIDDGIHWQAVKNGYPSVSTMDLKIQRRESALIIGTFGRAIWVLDDLKSLRELAAGRVNSARTALPMNDAVQVKGLFIAPPGNIWTGFHITFEGENRVFQKTKIPFYLKGEPGAMIEVTADIYAPSGKKINTINQAEVPTGLQYLTWKLDEHAATLPGAWIHDESRGVPVLPGEYQIVITAGDYTDTTQVTVMSDPRFSLPSSVDEALYTYKKAVNEQVDRLSSLLTALDDKTASLDKVLRYLRGFQEASGDDLPTAIKGMQARIKEVRAKGQTPRPDRQVGAWQSYTVTPYSTTADAQRKAMARMVAPSAQDWATVEQAKTLIDRFEQEVKIFHRDEWLPFATKLKQMALLPMTE